MLAGYYHPDKQRTTDQKLADVIRRYSMTHDETPTVVLVNYADFPQITEQADLTIRAVRHVAKDCFLVGCHFDDAVLS